MSSIRLDFVSQDHMVFSGDVSEILAPGIDGQLGILPKHAPLMTILAAGEVMVKRTAGDDLFFAVSGGWMEVRPDKVTILARTAERSDEIDLQRAEAARARAEELLAQGVERSDRTGLEMALKRSQIRVKVAGKRSGWRPTGPGAGDTQTPTGNHD
jgi:F-type H+-transporting ATPase subunit epsilon